MHIILSNPWPEVIGLMLLPCYVLFMYAKTKLKQPALECRALRGFSGMSFLLLQIRWHLFGVLISFLTAWFIFVSPHRQFLAIQADDKGLVLSYPWPRSNVDLKWIDIAQAEIARGKFGVLGATRFCLRIRAGRAVFCSPWSATAEEAKQALDLIQTHLNERQKST